MPTAAEGAALKTGATHTNTPIEEIIGEELVTEGDSSRLSLSELVKQEASATVMDFSVVPNLNPVPFPIALSVDSESDGRDGPAPILLVLLVGLNSKVVRIDTVLDPTGMVGNFPRGQDHLPVRRKDVGPTCRLFGPQKFPYPLDPIPPSTTNRCRS